IPAAVAEVLVTTTVLTDPPVFETFRMPFATEAQIADGLTATSHADRFAAWTRVAKAAMICERFDLRADEVEWYSHSDKTNHWMILADLPLEGTDVAFTRFDALRQALAVRELSKPDSLLLQEIHAELDFAS